MIRELVAHFSHSGSENPYTESTKPKMTATATENQTKEITPSPGVRFTVASRPQARFSNVQSVNNLTAASFSPIQLPATGFVRGIGLEFTQTGTFASGGTLVTGDSPWNLINGITLTDATGQPIMQPISGYNAYLINKYFPSGRIATNHPLAWMNPHLGPDYRCSVTGTAIDVHFRLQLDLEQDFNTGYGCIPNLDSNASLQLKIDYAAYTNVATGTTPSAILLSVRVSQYYWAPVQPQLNGTPVQDQPVGFGDYLETRYETQPVSASSENLVTLTNRGGFIKGIILVSRAAGVRTDYTAGSNVGQLLDNNPITEGIPLAEYQDMVRRTYGYFGADLTTTYAPLTAGVLPGLDRGVLPIYFGALSGGRDSWLNTRTGSLLQTKITPGASATQLEIVTQLMQVRDPAAFFSSSALD